MAPKPDPKFAALVLGLGTLVSHGFGLSLVPALLPAIEDTFDSGFAVLGGAVAAGLVSYAVGGLLASKVLDSFPNRTVLNMTFVFTAGALALAATAGAPVVIAVPAMVLGVSAPVSWAATTHVAARSVDSRWRGIVMGAAAGGVGLGVIVNGLLVHFFARPDGWRVACVVASVLSLLVLVSSLIVFRTPIRRPSDGRASPGVSGSYRDAIAEWPGRVVVVTSAAAGVGAYTFGTFLTATAIESIGSSPTAAGALLWIMGGVGVFASLFLGGLGDRRPPSLIVAWMFVVCAAGLMTVAVLWNYPGLVFGALGVAVLNYPVWGLVAAIAANRYDAPRALAAISLGLVAASSLSALASIGAGLWLDQVGTMRVPIAFLAAQTGIVGVWLLRSYRAHVGEDTSPAMGGAS